jgi:hypothetical protein
MQVTTVREKRQRVAKTVKTKQNIMLNDALRKFEIEFNLKATFYSYETFKGFSLFYD